MKEYITKVYTFSELNDEAKEKAREWWREHGLGYAWWEHTYDYVAEAADILGIDLRTRKWKDRKGEDHYGGINIQFSGFSSQGDGACFNGTYSYQKGSVAKVKKEFPRETGLHEIAEGLQSVQKRAFYRLRAHIKPGSLSNYYSHYNTREITVEDDNDTDYSQETWRDFEDGIEEFLKDFMKWIYEKLEKEYDWLMSDEQVDETIECNEYEFTEDGTKY